MEYRKCNVLSSVSIVSEAYLLSMVDCCGILLIPGGGHSRSFHPVSLFDNLGVGHLLPAFPPVEDPCHCTAQGSDSREHLPPAGLGSKYSRWVLSFDSWPQKP